MVHGFRSVWHSGQAEDSSMMPDETVRPSSVRMVAAPYPVDTFCNNCGKVVVTIVEFEPGTCTHLPHLSEESPSRCLPKFCCLQSSCGSRFTRAVLDTQLPTSTCCTMCTWIVLISMASAPTWPTYLKSHDHFAYLNSVTYNLLVFLVEQVGAQVTRWSRLFRCTWWNR